jgi:Arylsulfotransferase (ASST)
MLAEGGWTRGDFLARAGAGLGMVGAGYRLLVHDLASAARAAEKPTVRRFVSRPDLVPPVLTVSRAFAGIAPGLLFLAPPSGPGQRGAMIADNRGDVVWFRPSTPQTTMDFRPGVYKGKPVLTWWEGRHVKGVGRVGAYVMYDQTYRQIARFRSRNGLRPDFHEYMLTPQGTALVTSYNPVPADLTAVGGPKRGTAYDGVVQELAIPSGRVLWEWHSLKHVEIAESYQTQVGNPYDYFHINSIGFDVDGNLLISSRNTWTIYKVDRRTGRVIWRLGGKKSDFAMGKGTAFAFQHDARSRDHGRMISMFDNGPDAGAKKPRSSALFIAIDTKRMRATLARRIVHAPPLYAFATGNTQVLPDGHTFVCWGITGWFTEYSAGGKVLFDAHLPKGGQNYRVCRYPWVGRPHEPPRLAAQASGGTMTLYASWNGATQVASWQVLSGGSMAKLQGGETSPRRGFETQLAAPDGASYAAVRALDRSGKVLGTSNTVKL